MHNKILPFLNIYPFFNSPRVSCFSCALLFFSIRSPKLGTRNHRRPVCSRSSRNEIVRSHIFVPRNLISRNSRQRKCHDQREMEGKIFGTPDTDYTTPRN